MEIVPDGKHLRYNGGVRQSKIKVNVHLFAKKFLSRQLSPRTIVLIDNGLPLTGCRRKEFARLDKPRSFHTRTRDLEISESK